MNHQLNNDFINSKVYDYSPFIFTFTISHVDNKNFKEEITIIQKPAISVTAELNSYREAYNKATDKSAYRNKSDQNGVNGYQYVNGYTYVSNNDDFEDEKLPNYGGAQGLTGHNTHPYMYVIEVTVLPEGSDYVLGDPRDPTPFNPTDYSNFVSAPGIEGATSRKLMNYYSTSRETSVQNMIAPKFRIASSHGAVDYFISYEDAFNRAATYQEDGYPAGRWRVPTLAEVRFVTKLYSDGYIPSLFSSGTTYWHANGSVTPNSGGTVSTSTSTSGDNTVRCVYDDWYWENSYYPRMSSLGNHPDKYSQFTWGDEVSQTN